jgi:hypothetical protein
MRSSKSRSRNKSNRNRSSSSLGNVVNRVFDSSGPEGKVRGTPQQIIDKYNQLARDAQLSGDRVATENFQQHSEHYLRLLGVAQKEQDARREEQERQNRERQADRDRERAQRQERESNGSDEAHQSGEHRAQEPRTHNQHPTGDLANAPQPDMPEPIARDGDSGLVATPEGQNDAAPAKPKRPRKPRKKPEAAAPAPGEEPSEAAE